MSTKLEPADRVTPERRDELLNKIVDIVDRYQLYAPAAFFLTLGKPLAFVGSQAMFMLSPIVGAFVDETAIEDYAQLMTDRDNIEYLLNMLEERELEGRKKLQAQKAERAAQGKPGLLERVKGIFRKS
ncbi:MAG: hypothetical protein ACOX2K_09715 [Bacillota bacterium]|jgi:hypothetical protein